MGNDKSMPILLVNVREGGMMRYLIIDGNFFMYRAIHKMGDLKRKDGLNTGMEYGFLRMVKATVDKIKPNKIFVVFDSGISPRRKMCLPQYKENRKNRHNRDGGRDVALTDMLTSLRISVFSYDGVEADDIIGLVSGLIEEKEELIIASSDTDFCQLIRKNVKVFNPIKREYLESPVDPRRYVIYKAMVGDTADNIPGIKGIGPKKAKRKLDDSVEWKRIGDDWTPEESSIISINEEVIFIPVDIDDFGLYYPKTDLDDFRQRFSDWMGWEGKCDFDKFFYFCRVMEFHSIESNRTSWQNTFGEKITLDDVWD